MRSTRRHCVWVQPKVLPLMEMSRLRRCSWQRFYSRRSRGSQNVEVQQAPHLGASIGGEMMQLCCCS
jgi:hypothetical protein